ncbi:MAG: hypothetical protein GY936_14635 [Ignavibacteriae bacterium]|nr:hypothetical protein [Ignavibacteriota bacterium]
MIKQIKFLTCLLILFVFNSCELKEININEISEEENSRTIPVRIAKWYNNHTAALSINNDAGSTASKAEQAVQKLVLEHNLTMDYEFVTKLYKEDSIRWNYFENTFLTNGFGYFGHGDTHINHDALTEDEAYISFKKCYDTMIELGLKPVSYAYPGGFGYLMRTHRALKKAGFIASRMFEKLNNENPYILPGNETEPENWFMLPSLVMQAYDYKSCTICINNTKQLIPHLNNTLEKNAWLILTYHSIGQTGSYGYYHLNDFKNDLIEIAKRDFWVTHNDDITLYVFERNAAEVEVKLVTEKEDNKEKIQIRIDDNLDNEKFNIPLTLLFDIPQEWLQKKIKLEQGGTIIREYEFETNPVKISILPNEKKYELVLE